MRKITFLIILIANISLAQNDVLSGFSFFSRIPGIWFGPVYSSSSAGSFDFWFLDFRPVAPGEIAQYSMLDSNTINNMMFFVCTYKGLSRIAMRTEGCFQNQCCVTYELLDSVNEDSGYYRFSDVIQGTQRAYTEFVFTDSTFIMQVYTTKFGGISIPALHSRLNAQRGDATSAYLAVEYFHYPKSEPLLDMTYAFDGMQESIFYEYSNDIYKAPEKYMSEVYIDINVASGIDGADGDIFVLLATESLYDGLKLKTGYRDYFSKCVFLPAGTTRYTLKDLHPGEYYLYAFIDLDGDRKHLKGDLMSSDTENVFRVKPGTSAEISTFIDMIIP